MKFLVVFIFAASSLFAGEPKFQERWKECKAADECVRIKGSCGKCQAVNKIYRKKSEHYFRQKSMTVKCTEKPQTLANVVCFYQKCKCHR